MAEIEQLTAESKRLCKAVRLEMERLNAAYGWTQDAVNTEPAGGQAPAESYRAMLNQCQEYVDAILADMDALNTQAQPKPKRVRPHKSYTFRRSVFSRREATIQSPQGREQVFEPTRANYNRFVRLANTGNYVITIEDSDYGVAWTLSRKSA